MKHNIFDDSDESNQYEQIQDEPESAIEKWEIIFTKMKEDLYAREFEECANGLKEKIYLSISEIEELLILLRANNI